MSGQRQAVGGDERDVFHPHVQFQNRRQALEFSDRPLDRFFLGAPSAEQGSHRRTPLPQAFVRLIQQALDLVHVLALQLRPPLFELIAQLDVIESHQRTGHGDQRNTA